MGHSSTPSDDRWCWAVYRWVPQEMRWRFDRYWGMQKSEPVLYDSPSASLAGPPDWRSITVNTLGAGYSVFFVSYPAPPTWKLLFDSIDPRFNPDLER